MATRLLWGINIWQQRKCSLPSLRCYWSRHLWHWRIQLRRHVAGAASAILGALDLLLHLHHPNNQSRKQCIASRQLAHLKVASWDALGRHLCQYLSSIHSRPVAWSEHTTWEGLKLGQGNPSWSLYSHPMLGKSLGSMFAIQMIRSCLQSLPQHSAVLLRLQGSQPQPWHGAASLDKQFHLICLEVPVPHLMACCTNKYIFLHGKLRH